MKAYKWNFNKEIEEIDISNNSILYGNKEIVNCASCGCEVRRNAVCRSIFIKDNIGLNYAICENCHKKELEEEDRQRKKFFESKRNKISQKCQIAIKEIMHECDKHLLCETCPFIEYNEEYKSYFCYFNKFQSPTTWGMLLNEVEK